MDWWIGFRENLEETLKACKKYQKIAQSKGSPADVPYQYWLIVDFYRGFESWPFGRLQHLQPGMGSPGFPSQWWAIQKSFFPDDVPSGKLT